MVHGSWKKRKSSQVKSSPVEKILDQVSEGHLLCQQMIQLQIFLFRINVKSFLWITPWKGASNSHVNHECGSWFRPSHRDSRRVQHTEKKTRTTIYYPLSINQLFIRTELCHVTIHVWWTHGNLYFPPTKLSTCSKALNSSRWKASWPLEDHWVGQGPVQSQHHLLLSLCCVPPRTSVPQSRNLFASQIQEVSNVPYCCQQAWRKQ